MADRSDRRTGWYTSFLSISCLVLAVLVVLLVLKTRSLQGQIARDSARGGHPQPGVISDSFYYDVGLIGKDGPVYPEYGGDGQWTAMLFFTESCDACREIMPLWVELVSGIPESDLRVYGIRLDMTGFDADWAAAKLLPFELYGLELEASREAFGMAVPATILLDEWGTVVRTSYGMPESGQLEGFRSMIESR